jgi:PAS domain S-box-containing protein
LGVAVAQLTLDGTLLTVNDYLCELTGYQRRDLLGRNFRDFFLFEESPHESEIALARLIAGEIYRYTADMSVRRTEGAVVWFKIVFSLVLDKATNAPLSLIVVAKDSTSLKHVSQELHESELARDELSRRMMGAQEADRTRIARELHDDIGQSLAILKIQMLRAGNPISDNPQKAYADLKELAGKLETIIQRVSRLSHDLHSPELEFMGLAVAVKSHCRECARELNIPIKSQCDKVDRKLDSVIALAFLRVVQEAIHNATKHSRATEILVRLHVSDRDLRLEISDDGVGFDIEETRLGSGLGLISMRERIHLIGGEFTVTSSPGNGTQIMARVPIPANAR